MTKKRAYYVGFNGIYATYCVFRRKSPILKKFLQCIILQPEYCRSYNMYTPPRIYCNHFCIFMHFLLLAPCAGNVPLHQIPRTAGCRCLIPRAASCRGRVPRTGVTALHSLLRGQPRVIIAQPVARPTACHSEPPRMRRVEESTCAAAKRLLCNHARVPTHKLYCSPARSFDFEPRFSLGSPLRMAERAA